MPSPFHDYVNITRPIGPGENVHDVLPDRWHYPVLGTCFLPDPPTLTAATGVRMRSRRRRGSTSVELALGSVPLSVLTVGAADWGWYFARHHTVAQVARDATMAGSTADDEEDPVVIAETRAKASLEAAHFDAEGITVQASTVTSPDVDGQILQIDIRVEWAPLGGLIPMPETLRSTSTFLLVNR